MEPLRPVEENMRDLDPLTPDEKREVEELLKRFEDKNPEDIPNWREALDGIEKDLTPRG
jgi:hypothetical protein